MLIDTLILLNIRTKSICNSLKREGLVLCNEKKGKD